VRLIEQASRPANPSVARSFVLPATTRMLLGPDDGEDVRLYRVDFDLGARTNWHVHEDGAQLLYGLTGRCVVVDRAGDELLLGPGDLVVVDAGEEHWHGAAPGGSGAHLAINLGGNTRWLESSADG
jgi:quercetin dioxygenase-like cupin family protein